MQLYLYSIEPVMNSSFTFFGNLLFSALNKKFSLMIRYSLFYRPSY